MNRTLILDTSIGSSNRGDDIIMECCREELKEILNKSFELSLPTHVSPFHWYQVLRDSNAVKNYSTCELKFACGTNLLIPKLLTHYPQWNINLFNYKPLIGTILLGVGAGAGAEGKIQRYTRYIYKNLLNKDFLHSLRDERSKKYVSRLGLKGINTGCVTMWKLTPEFCKEIPSKKSDTVICTITASGQVNPQDQKLIDILDSNYEHIYFWPQGINDFDYIKKLKTPKRLIILPPTKDAYDDFLSTTDTDYVGTRLHGGVYAMRHRRRSIIIAIDERARAIHNDTNINCVEQTNIEELQSLINCELETRIRMPIENIARWKSQFGI